MAKNQRLSYIYAIIAVFFWSTVATAFKISLSYVSSFTLLFYASLFSCVILFFVLLLSKNEKIFSRKQIMYSTFLGFINPFAYYLILFKAYDLLEAQIAQPLNYTWPIVLSIFSIFFLNQKFKIKLLFSIILSFVGVSLLSLSQASLTTNFNFFGIFLALGSAFVWATYWILNVKRKCPVFEGLFLNFLFGTIYSFIFLLVIHNPINIPIASLFPLIYVGAFEMSVTFIFWFKALSYWLSL
jgi:drug/metabolite transporter (DMT)-like permease